MKFADYMAVSYIAFFHILLVLFCITVYMVGSVILTQYCAGGKIETNEMGRACGSYGRG
jgi:hypothetical protein